MGFEARFDGRSTRSIPELLILGKNPKQILRANRFNKLLVTGPTDMLVELVKFPERENLQMLVYENKNDSDGCRLCVEDQNPQTLSIPGIWQEIFGLLGARARWLADGQV